MPTPLDKIKPEVRAIHAYTLAPLTAPIKINQNENPFEMPDEIKVAVLHQLATHPWSRYPTFIPTALQEKLAKHAGWRNDGVLAGNGSNELIQAAMTVTVGAGTRVIIPEPTFTLYRQLVSVLGGEIISIPLTKDFQFDIAAIRGEIVRTQPDLTILCSPNNPTGNVISGSDLISLLRETEGLIIVDQAYMEFGGADFVPLLKDYPNLIILRTFSKAMAMAGLRVGYLLAAPELVVEINKAKLPYNLNFFSISAAEAAVENFHLLQPLIDGIRRERDRLFGELRQIKGLEPVPSEGNFFAVRTAVPPKELFEALHARGILVRDVSKYPMLADYVRLSVGTPGENERLLNALREIFAEL
jgi:histidinol-phosphate aminotransferase